MMILTLEADRVSIWPFSVEVTPMEIDGPGMLIGTISKYNNTNSTTVLTVKQYNYTIF